MPETKNEIIQQFKKNSTNTVKKIKFDSEKSKTSYYGLLMLLSNMYFDADDKIRKNIQRDFYEYSRLCKRKIRRRIQHRI